MASHVVSARRRGVTDAELEALEEPDRWPDVFDEPVRWILQLADAVSGPSSHALEPELIAGLRRHFDEEQIGELLLVAGQANLNNRVGNAAKQLLGSPEDT